MAEKKEHNVPALRRSAAILDLLCTTPDRLAAADIVKSIGIPKSTGHGLINVMLELEMVQRDTDGAIRPGPRLSRWSNGFLSDINLLEAFQRLSREWQELLPYTLTLSVPDNDEVVYIACRNSNLPLGFTFKIGMRLPIIYTATGKAIISTWTDEALTKVVTTNPWPQPVTPRGVQTLPALREEIEATRERGFSIDDGQIREGMICLGSAIKDYTQKAVAGIAVSMTDYESTTASCTKVGQEIAKAAQQLSRLVGYQAET